MHALALHDAGSLELEGTTTLDRDLAETVDRVAERVDDTAEEAVADADREHLAGTGDALALFDAEELASTTTPISFSSRFWARPACRSRSG